MSTDNNRFEEHVPKVDLWRDSMVGQISEFMDKVKDLDVEGADGADTVLEEAFESIADNSADAVMNMLTIYSHSDTSGRSAIAEVFHALTGETFDYFLMQASDACQQALGPVEDETLDEMMEHTAEVAGDSGLGEELGVSNEVR